MPHRFRSTVIIEGWGIRFTLSGGHVEKLEQGERTLVWREAKRLRPIPLLIHHVLIDSLTPARSIRCFVINGVEPMSLTGFLKLGTK